MATDYSTLKVADLKEKLKERGLNANGNKADLVARLHDDDKAKNPETAAAAEDEIDWDDEAPAAAADAQPVPAAGKPAEASEPAPSTALDAPLTPAEAETKKDDAPKDSPPENKDDEKAEPVPAAEPLTQGLAPTDVDEEAKKREARAKRFGKIEKDDDEKKKQERAARFGIEASTVSSTALDSALPDRPRKRGRGDEEGPSGGDRNRGNKRQRGGRGVRGGGGGGGGRQGGNGGRKGGQGGDRGVLADPEDRRKAEARKARFAQG